jgi:cytochrome c oxidase assembly protein subunit 16
MTAFSSTPLNKSPLHKTLQRNPALFGIPFVLMMVGASFALANFTQTKYDYQDKKVTTVRPL